MTQATELPPVIVIGQRPVYGVMMVPTKGPDDGVHQQEVTPEDGGGGGGSTLATPEEVAAEEKRQKDCAAQKFKDRLQQKGDRNSKEYFSFTFVRNGEIVTSELRGGAGARINGSDITAAMNEFGITAGDLLGFNHNHPNNEYCNGPDGYTRYIESVVNAYPSDNDWNATATLLNPSQNPNFSLYISGCDGTQREYPFSARQSATQARNSQASPPAAIQPHDCP